MGAGPSNGKGLPSRVARPFVYLLLALIALSAYFEWEPWPVSSFRLFSHVRQAEQSAWEVTAKSGAAEVPYLVDSMPQGFKNFSFRMHEFETSERGRQDELCRVWFIAAPEVDNEPARQIRISRRTWNLDQRADDRALPGETELIYVCDGTGLRWSKPEADQDG